MEIFRRYSFFNKIVSAYKTRSTSVIQKQYATHNNKRCNWRKSDILQGSEKASISKSMCSLETSEEFSTTGYTFRTDSKPVFY